MYRVPVLQQQVDSYIPEYGSESQCTPGPDNPIYIEPSSAVQRRFGCRAVRCLAMRCGAVLVCAVLCFEHTALPRIRVVVHSYFNLFLHFMTSLGPMVFHRPKLTPVNCTADQNVTPPTSAQHITGQIALHKKLLALSVQSSHQTTGLLFLPILHVLGATMLARA